MFALTSRLRTVPIFHVGEPAGVNRVSSKFRKSQASKGCYHRTSNLYSNSDVGVRNARCPVKDTTTIRASQGSSAWSGFIPSLFPIGVFYNSNSVVNSKCGVGSSSRGNDILNIYLEYLPRGFYKSVKYSNAICQKVPWLTGYGLVRKYCDKGYNLYPEHVNTSFLPTVHKPHTAYDITFQISFPYELHLTRT